ncbi:MAG: putative iron-sulfur cluster-binding metallochaperone [Vicinamibacteria bacterium]
MDCRERELDSRTCPLCRSLGRSVQLITVKSLLTARALEKLTLQDHRFCATPDCEVVYYSEQTVYRREGVRVPVFQKEPSGRRIVCYCFEVSEDDADAGAESRIRTHVQAGRCACELRNPEGRCCLGNLWAFTRVTTAEVSQDG